MRDYERLRDALKNILLVLGPSYDDLLTDAPDIDVIDDDWFGDKIEDIATKILADTPKTSEMERLVEWMRDERVKDKYMMTHCSNHETKTKYQYYAQKITMILDHIRTKFGYGEDA